MKQTTHAILLVSPTSFGFNPETAMSNVFQHDLHLEKKLIQQKAQKEWEEVCAMLSLEGIDIITINDTETPIKPDAIFPNNWITTHNGGEIVLYPLLAHNRRIEKRSGIVDELKKMYFVSKVIDLSFFEEEDQFLEGTGSMVLDRKNKIIYACLSARTHVEPLTHLAKLLGYKTVTFHAFDREKPIYHTNVLMSVGEKWACVCLDAIPDKAEREKVEKSLLKTGKEIIPLTYNQLEAFAGNTLELQSKTGVSKIIMSKATKTSLNPKQLKAFSKYGNICSVDIPIIEQVGGGGIRCLIAEIFLPSKQPSQQPE